MISIVCDFNLITLHDPDTKPEVMKVYEGIKEVTEIDNRGYTITRPLFSQSDLPSFLKLKEVQLNEVTWNEDTVFSVLLHHNNALAAKHINLIPEIIQEKVKAGKCKLILDNVLEGHPIDGFLDNLYPSLKQCNIPPNQVYYVTNNLLAEDIHKEYAKRKGIKEVVNVISFMYNVHDTKRLQQVPLFRNPIIETPNERLVSPKQLFALPEDVDIKKEIEYKKENLDKLRPFLKVNRTNREERNLMMLFLNKHKLLERSYVSFPDYPENYKYPSGLFTAYTTQENIHSLKEKLPFDIDESDRYNHGPAGFDLNNFNADLPFNPTHYRNSLISIVMCAFPFDHGACHLHSSTFNPIFCGHPVIQFGPYKHLRKLRELGFKTFDKWWDESYDEIEDGWNRFIAVLATIKTLADKSTQELLEMYIDMQDILQHNHDLIKNYNGSKILIGRILGNEK